MKNDGKMNAEVALQKLKLNLYKVAYFCNHVKTTKTTKSTGLIQKKDKI